MDLFMGWRVLAAVVPSVALVVAAIAMLFYPEVVVHELVEYGQRRADQVMLWLAPHLEIAPEPLPRR